MISIQKEAPIDQLRQALLGHPWRLPKDVTYLFDWIASVIHDLLHPRPRFFLATG
jgi:hypothetical protein